MAITFTLSPWGSGSASPSGYNAVIPGMGNAQSSPSSTLGSANTSPVQAPNLSSLYSTSQSQFQSTPGATIAYNEDPRLTSMLQLQMNRANQSDDEINSQADAAYSAQRKAAETGINRQQTRALAANGVLPTGGLASQYYNEISQPVFERLDAQRAQSLFDLRNARDNVRGSVTSTLSGIDNNKNQFALSQVEAQRQAQYQAQQLAAQQAYQQASLQQQSALASQQLAAEQARAQQSASLAQQQLDYERQRDSQSLAFQREQAQMANQRFYSGQGSATGSMGGGNTFGTLGSGSVFGEQDARNMQQNYDTMWNGTGESTWGRSTYRPPSNSPYPTASSSTRPQTQSQSSAMSGVSLTQPGSAPTMSFYTPPASGSFFSPTGSMFA